MKREKLHFSLTRMVFDFPKFEKYPYGKVAFKNLIESMNNVNLFVQSFSLQSLHGRLNLKMIHNYHQ